MVKYVLVTNAAKWLFIKYLESKNDHSLEKQTAKFCVAHDRNSVKNYHKEKENTVGGNTLGGKVYIFPLSPTCPNFLKWPKWFQQLGTKCSSNENTGDILPERCLILSVPCIIPTSEQ